MSRPGRARGALLALVFLLLAAGFAALGTWQVERRAWKRDLIARVDRRLAAAPIAAPGPADWRRLTQSGDEYRQVRSAGRYMAGRDTFVRASTVLGPGYWLLAPFRDRRGFTVLINRGFVLSRETLPPPGERAVTGLLRSTEPGGTLLNSNVPPANRWYSRDVAAIAQARRLGPVAPYFIDAAAGANPRTFPRGGLTVVTFPNNHLIYALTWFALMLLSGGAAVVALRRESR